MHITEYFSFSFSSPYHLTSDVLKILTSYFRIQDRGYKRESMNLLGEEWTLPKDKIKKDLYLLSEKKVNVSVGALSVLLC